MDATTPSRRSPDGTDARPAAADRIGRALRIRTVVPDAVGDGIRLYGIAAAQTRSQAARPTTWSTVADVDTDPRHVDVVHAHLTDRTVEEHPDEWAALLGPRRPDDATFLVATVHDVPEEAEGRERSARRAARLVDLCQHVDLVIVSSEHERRGAAAIGIATAVVPHPLPTGGVVAPGASDGRSFGSRHRRPNSLTIAGFVHPGKGIVELLDAIGDVRGSSLDGWQLRLVGGHVADHDDYLDRVAERCARFGLAVHHTGAVDDRRWADELRSATIPVAPHLHCSASGSMLAWAAHSRRPFVSDIPFARELSDERPDAVSLVDAPGGWREALTAAATSHDPCRFDPAGWRTAIGAVDRLDALIGAAWLDRRSPTATVGGRRAGANRPPRVAVPAAGREMAS